MFQRLLTEHQHLGLCNRARLDLRTLHGHNHNLDELATGLYALSYHSQGQKTPSMRRRFNSGPGTVLPAVMSLQLFQLHFGV
jgi:hypothetical protein